MNALSLKTTACFLLWIPQAQEMLVERSPAPSTLHGYRQGMGTVRSRRKVRAALRSGFSLRRTSDVNTRLHSERVVSEIAMLRQAISPQGLFQVPRQTSLVALIMGQ